VSHLMSLVAVCSDDGLLGARDALFSCIQEALQLIQGESADGQDLPQHPFCLSSLTGLAGTWLYDHR